MFALGALLAGLGGALQIAREPANLATDLIVIGDAFVVVVVGGMGSISGAYLAAVIIAEVKALCIGLGVVNFGGFTVNFSKLTLVAEFLVMAVVLIVRPYGLLGRPQGAVRSPRRARRADPPGDTGHVKIAGRVVASSLLALPAADRQDLALYAGARHRRADRGAVRHQPAFHHGAGRHAFVRPCGLFRPRRLRRGAAGEMVCGADGARRWSAAPVLALVGALLFGWFAVRLSGVYLAMLTLAFAQIVWAAVFQWETRHRWLQRRASASGPPRRSTAAVHSISLTLALAARGVLLLRRKFLFAPFGYAMRAGRDSPLRAEAIGHRRQARALAGLRHCWRHLRHRRWAVRLRQGLDLAGDHRRQPLDRRSRHGAARRHPDADRPDRRRVGRSRCCRTP